MTFVSPDLAEAVALTSPTVVDGTVSTEANLNDDNTGTTASGEIRETMSGYRITHDIGFAVGLIDTLSIRCFDGVFMDVGGGAQILPYQSDDANVNTGNDQTLTLVDDASYDTLVLTSAFIADLEDIGTNQISIRIAANTGTRGRLNEIQIEFTKKAGGTPGALFVASTRIPQLRRRRT